MPKDWKKPKPTEGQRAKAASDAKKTIARNKKARHDYTIEDTWEAGLALMGTEVKALRMGRASLVDAWVEINGGEAWLYGANIPLYSQGSWTNHAPTRKRKLLLHRAEIERMQDRVAAKGYTIVPLELYFIGGRVRSKSPWPRASRNGISARRCAKSRTSARPSARCAATSSRPADRGKKAIPCGVPSGFFVVIC